MLRNEDKHISQRSENFNKSSTSNVPEVESNENLHKQLKDMKQGFPQSKQLTNHLRKSMPNETNNLNASCTGSWNPNAFTD